MGCQGSGQERETGGMPRAEAFRLGTCMKVQEAWRGEGNGEGGRGGLIEGRGGIM